MELFVSFAEVDDAQMLIDYFNQVGGESDFLTYGANGCKMNVLSEMDLIEDISQQENSCLLLGFIDDKLVAVASLIGDQQRMAHTSELGISVKKDYWHMAIGSSMMEELVLYAKEHSIEMIYLEVRSDNIAAIALYQKFGFIQTGIMPKRFKIGNDYYDALMMSLDLTD